MYSLKNNHLKLNIFFIALFSLIISCKKADSKNGTPYNEVSSLPLPSFNEGVSKKSIIDFVTKITDKNSTNYVDPNDRIVVFDNDGTLWAEQPLPSQIYFCFDQIKTLSNQYPNMKTEMPFKAVLDNDLPALIKEGSKGVFKMVGTTDSLLNNNYNTVVNQWIDTAKHPKLGILYKNTVYQPMLEVLAYLRENDFKIYIVSGGGMKFMRAWQPRIYGVNEENIIGSTFKTDAVIKDDKIKVIPTTEFEFNDDHFGKVINIEKFINKKPIMIFGNSDGDLEMMEYATTDNKKPTLMVFINHTDAEREFKYDKNTLAGRLEKGMVEAKKRGWVVVDMKNDWKTIFPKN